MGKKVSRRTSMPWQVFRSIPRTRVSRGRDRVFCAPATTARPSVQLQRNGYQPREPEQTLTGKEDLFPRFFARISIRIHSALNDPVGAVERLPVAIAPTVRSILRAFYARRWRPRGPKEQRIGHMV